MEGQLTNGTELTSEFGKKYKVLEMLGAGGQGENSVVRVEVRGS